jgi:transcriptional regulator GlxA family with amidase domain
MPEMKLNLTVFFNNVKNNVCAYPLALIFCKTKMIAQDLPHYFFVWLKHRDFKLASMHILIVVVKYRIKLIGIAFNFFRPPATHIRNGIKNLFRACCDCKGSGVIWIAQQYQQGAEVASVCTGAYLLAATGLLDGKHCSTHWAAAADFKVRFPQVNLQPEKLITDEHGIYTNGGAYSFLNLIIYLIEKYYDRHTAIYCAKVFQIEVDRQSQQEFIIFKGQKQHGDDLVKEAQLYIEKNLHEKIVVAHLSEKFAIGRRNFDRRFTKATGNTPLEYLQRAKVEWAKRAFENNHTTINEVMYQVGYADVKAFREVFRKITGLSPLAYRRKFNDKPVAKAAS